MSERSADTIFASALARPQEQRAAYVATACGGDDALRAEVESLLRAHEAAGTFLDTPLSRDAVRNALGDTPEPDVLIGARLGAYHVEGVIGSGGMGTVYVAHRTDSEYEERVAIKVVRRGLDTEDVLARFRNERQVLANLRHPAIATLLDGGATPDGRPFLVMEYVTGRPLTEYATGERLDARGRIALMRRVCAAVDHAHRNLVIHRDLKPSNILVTNNGTIKLLDFGIAKMLHPEQADVAGTVTQTRLMTPRYASPEQVRAEATTTATDVYALGLVTYELLTGRFPYRVDGTSVTELERAILGTDPSPPSTHASLPSDTDAVVLKAINKDPERRYGSVRHLSDDLERILDARPVMARPDGVWYRTRTFIRRNRVPVLAGALVGTALILATAMSTTQYVRANRARQSAEHVGTFLQTMLGSIDPAVARGRDVTLLRDILDDAAARLDQALVTEPEVAFALHHTMARVYDAIAEYASAETHARRTLELARDLDGSDAVADALVTLASVLRSRGEYEEAESALVQVIDIHRRAARPDSARIGVAINGLGRVAEFSGRYDEAEAHYREAMALLDGNGSEGDPGRLNAQVNLAVLLMNSDRADEAEPLLRDAADARRRFDHPPLVTSTTLHNLAGLLRRRGAYAEAESLYREVLATKRRFLGDDHPDVAVVLNGLATNEELRGHLEEAEPLYRETLAIQRRAFGPDHRDVGTTLNNLAGLLSKQGHHDAADSVYAATLDVYRSALGAEHAWVAIAATNRARNLLDAGQYAEAEHVAIESLRLHATHFAPDHWRVRVTESVRGAALAGLGHFPEAESLCVRSARSLEAHLGLESPATTEAWRRAIRLYEDWDRPAAADALRARLIQTP